MRVGLYARVSTLEQKKKGNSIAEQVERLESFAKAKGWTYGEPYIDGGYSGATMDRPALQEILEHAQEGRIEAVVVYKLDRLSRSQRDTLEIIENVLTPAGAAFVSVTESFDTSTPFGMAMVGLLSIFAQLERAQIAERMAMGVSRRAKKGKWHGAAFSPVGYKYEHGELEIIEYEAAMIRDAFDMFNRRIPIKRICSILKQKGYRHRYGYMLPSSLGRLLKNDLYAGYIEKDGELYEGIHEAIVSRETFDKAQKVFEERARDNPNAKSAFKGNSMLSGLLVCKHCGAGFCRNMGHVKNDGTKTKFYSCYSRNKKSAWKVKDPNCKNKIWVMEELDELVFEQVRNLALDPSFIEDIRSRDDKDDTEEQIRVMEERIEELSASIARTTQLFGISGLDFEEVKSQLEPMTEERSALRAEVEALKRDRTEDLEHIVEVASTFGDVIDSGDVDGIRFVIEELIESIDIDNDNIRIKWKFA